MRCFLGLAIVFMIYLADQAVAAKHSVSECQGPFFIRPTDGDYQGIVDGLPVTDGSSGSIKDRSDKYLGGFSPFSRLGCELHVNSEAQEHPVFWMHSGYVDVLTDLPRTAYPQFAQAYCEELGGRLPTLDEVDSLSSFFDDLVNRNYGPQMLAIYESLVRVIRQKVALEDSLPRDFASYQVSSVKSDATPVREVYQEVCKKSNLSPEDAFLFFKDADPRYGLLHLPYDSAEMMKVPEGGLIALGYRFSADEIKSIQDELVAKGIFDASENGSLKNLHKAIQQLSIFEYLAAQLDFYYYGHFSDLKTKDGISGFWLFDYKIAHLFTDSMVLPKVSFDSRIHASGLSRHQFALCVRNARNDQLSFEDQISSPSMNLYQAQKNALDRAENDYLSWNNGGDKKFYYDILKTSRAQKVVFDAQVEIIDAVKSAVVSFYDEKTRTRYEQETKDLYRSIRQEQLEKAGITIESIELEPDLSLDDFRVSEKDTCDMGDDLENFLEKNFLSKEEFRWSSFHLFNQQKDLDVSQFSKDETNLVDLDTKPKVKKSFLKKLRKKKKSLDNKGDK